MKKLLLVIGLLLGLGAGVAYAACTTTTVWLPGGKILSCTTCCTDLGSCTTTCY